MIFGTCRDFDNPSRGIIVFVGLWPRPEYTRCCCSKMGKVPRIFGPGGKKRKRYTTVYEWRKKDNMELIDIEKKCKEQFNIHAAEGLFGATASGHMFKPLIIGKARWPRAFAHLDKD